MLSLPRRLVESPRAVAEMTSQQRKEIRFTTYTLKYNECDWLTIEDRNRAAQPPAVERPENEGGTG